MSSLLNDNLQSPNFYSLSFDMRAYSSTKNKISTALRLFGGHLGGADVNRATFRVGGTTYLPFFSDEQNQAQYELYYDIHDSEDQIYYNQYVMPLRGKQKSNKLGNNVLLVNLELRLPFLVYYFPAIKYLGQINGVIFTDFGVAWNNKYPEFWDVCSWESSITTNDDCDINEDYTGWAMSYGFGPRFIFLGMPWQLDYAWQYNPHKGTVSDRNWYLTIGLDF